MALTDNLISYWKLNETTGNATDSVGSNTLTNTGTVTYGAGKISNGAIFNGSSNYLSASSLSLVTNTWTVSAWLNPTNTNTLNQTFVSYRPASGNINIIQFEGQASGGFRCIIYGSDGTSNKSYTTSKTISAGTWSLFSATWDGTNFKIYVNGEEDTAVTKTVDNAVTQTLTSRTIRVGAETGASNFWNGKVDEVAIWSRALSEAEVKQLYNSGVALGHPFTSPLFAIWNKNDKEANVTLSNGDLTATSGTTLWRNVRATIGVSTGKWYWEIKTTGGTIETMAAIGTSAATLGGSWATFPGSDAVSYGYYGNGGTKYNNNSGVAYGASFSTNDVIGVALDMDAGTLTFYKNGTSQGQAYSGISGTFFPFLGLDASGQAVVANFGATPFAYPVPTGFNQGVYSGTYDTSFLTTGLQAYYKLDESSGNAADSVGSNTLTNNGTVTYGAGKIANGADFGTANTSKWLSSGTAIVDTSTSGISTVAGWVNISTSPASGVDYELFGAIKSGGRQFEYKYSNISGTLCLNLTVYDGGTAGVYQRNVTLTVGQWYLVAFVVIQNTIYIFVDGVQIGTIQTITNVSNGSAANNFTLGRHPNASAGYSCSKADETGVWNKALNALDISKLYNGGAGLTHPFIIVPATFIPKVMIIN